jgi:pimeloyl-ACP methyl ester carboxylesterase
LREQVITDPATLLDGFDLPEADREVLGRADLAAVMREATLERTRNGIWGWADDALAFVSSWEFDPAAIAVPTLVWYGTQDVLTPPGHGEWIARTVPGAVVRLKNLGHMGDPDADLIERLAWLTRPAPATPR